MSFIIWGYESIKNPNEKVLINHFLKKNAHTNKILLFISGCPWTTDSSLSTSYQGGEQNANEQGHVL